MMKSRKFVTADDVIKTDFSSTSNIKRQTFSEPSPNSRVSHQLKVEDWRTFVMIPEFTSAFQNIAEGYR